jgi:hypothetical protein
MQDSLIGPATVKGSLSIDRVTFLVFTPFFSLWSENEGEYRKNEEKISAMTTVIEKVLKNVLDEDFPQGIPSELFKHHYRTIDEVDIQLGSKMPRRKVKSDEDLIEAYGTTDVDDKKKYYYVPSHYGLRIEYNPNNTNLSSVSELLKVVSRVGNAGYIRMARLDIAIDFKASITPELVLCQGMRKSFSASGSKGLESVYFGTRKSTNYIRLYDKRQEQIDKNQIDIGYDLWRLELESKESFYLNEPAPDHGKVFQRFTFYDGAVSSGDWQVDMIRSQAMMFGLQNVLRRMPSRTAARYRKAFKEQVFTQNVESPAYIYARDFQKVFGKLRRDILTACGFEVV